MVMSMVNLFKVMTSLVNLFQSGDVTTPVDFFKVVMSLVYLLKW
jgi:hypothetical protein